MTEMCANCLHAECTAIPKIASKFDVREDQECVNMKQYWRSYK